MGTREDTTALRRCVLAVTVLHDVDLVPGDAGVAAPSAAREGLVLSWAELAAALGDLDPDSPAARQRMAGWVRDRTALSTWGPEKALGRARPVGLPHDHVLHPGPPWVRERVPGRALDLGIGLLGLRGDPDRVDVCDPAVLDAAGLDLTAAWPGARTYLEEMGALASATLSDGGTVLRPRGDCDVLTLLGSAVLRAALCAAVGDRMRAAVVPMRHRGWLDPRRVDPAFAGAAAAAVDAEVRGFTRPLLVTREEVVLAREGGRAVEITLRDPAGADSSWTRPVRYR